MLEIQGLHIGLYKSLKVIVFDPILELAEYHRMTYLTDSFSSGLSLTFLSLKRMMAPLFSPLSFCIAGNSVVNLMGTPGCTSLTSGLPNPLSTEKESDCI